MTIKHMWFLYEMSLKKKKHDIAREIKITKGDVAF
jgi:hypothetical protein